MEDQHQRAEAERRDGLQLGLQVRPAQRSLALCPASQVPPAYGHLS